MQRNFKIRNITTVDISHSHYTKISAMKRNILVLLFAVAVASLTTASALDRSHITDLVDLKGLDHRRSSLLKGGRDTCLAAKLITLILDIKT